VERNDHHLRKLSDVTGRYQATRSDYIEVPHDDISI